MSEGQPEELAPEKGKFGSASGWKVLGGIAAMFGIPALVQFTLVWATSATTEMLGAVFYGIIFGPLLLGLLILSRAQEPLGGKIYLGVIYLVIGAFFMTVTGIFIGFIY